jgi:hypothetical protein
VRGATRSGRAVWFPVLGAVVALTGVSFGIWTLASPRGEPGPDSDPSTRTEALTPRPSPARAPSPPAPEPAVKREPVTTEPPAVKSPPTAAVKKSAVDDSEKAKTVTKAQASSPTRAQTWKPRATKKLAPPPPPSKPKPDLKDPYQ